MDIEPGRLQIRGIAKESDMTEYKQDTLYGRNTKKIDYILSKISIGDHQDFLVTYKMRNEFPK